MCQKRERSQDRLLTNSVFGRIGGITIILVDGMVIQIDESLGTATST